MTTASEDWRRVGAYLAARRERLGYRKRAPWARHVERRGFRSRVITDLELGERDNYSDDTLAIAEEVYELVPGSILEAVNTGSDPRPLEDEEDEDEPCADDGRFKEPGREPGRFVAEERTHRLTGRVWRIVRDLEADTEGIPDDVAEEMIQRAMDNAEHQARIMLEADRQRYSRRRWTAQHEIEDQT